MFRSFLFVAFCVTLIATALSIHAEEKTAAKVPAALNFKVNSLDGKEVALS